jgi:hypothetical protein
MENGGHLQNSTLTPAIRHKQDISRFLRALHLHRLLRTTTTTSSTELCMLRECFAGMFGGVGSS